MGSGNKQGVVERSRREEAIFVGVRPDVRALRARAAWPHCSSPLLPCKKWGLREVLFTRSARAHRPVAPGSVLLGRSSEAPATSFRDT